MAAEWHYRHRGEQKGPVSGGELKRLATSGQIEANDLVWRDGLPKWVPASKVPGLIPEPSPGLDVFDLAEDPEPVATSPLPARPSAPGPKASSRPGDAPPRLKKKGGDQSGLSTLEWVLYTLGFLIIPFANVILSSVLYYVWRADKPRKANQINRLGFIIFGVNLLVLALRIALLRNQPGGPAGVAGLGNSPSAAPSAPEVYDSPSGAFRLRIPAGWARMQQSPSPQAEAAWQYQGRDCIGMASFGPTNFTTRQMQDAVIQGLRIAGAQPEVISDRVVNVGGKEVGVLEYKYAPENTPIQSLTYFYTGPSGGLQLVTFSSQAEFPQLQPAFQQFLDGLELLDAAPGAAPAANAGAASTALESTDLLTARRGFQTTIIPNSFEADGPALPPPPDVFHPAKFPSPSGPLSAYVTPDPGDGAKHPAVLWAHGGFGGIGPWFWQPPDPANDQTAGAFREAGIVLMVPSWRGENDNPGRFELFYGEVDDLLAARDYLASLPYVDPERIYIAGHSTGGTLALLAAESTDKFRAAFSFGGAPDLGHVVSDGKGYGNTPFDIHNAREIRLRSPLPFTRAIRRPTFYFEGSNSGYVPDALEMKRLAAESSIPFDAFIIQGGDHFSILSPITRLLARKITEDGPSSPGIQLTEPEVTAAFQSR